MMTYQEWREAFAPTVKRRGYLDANFQRYYMNYCDGWRYTHPEAQA